MALPQCLDEVESFAYDPDYGGEPHITLVGKKGKRDVVVEVYFEPFGPTTMALAVHEAIAALYPDGLMGIDCGDLVRRVFLHL